MFLTPLPFALVGNMNWSRGEGRWTNVAEDFGSCILIYLISFVQLSFALSLNYKPLETCLSGFVNVLKVL